MSKSKRHHPNPRDEAKPDPYAEVTARLLAAMAEGTVPWVRPWKCRGKGAGALPTNGATGRPYSGINVLTLWLAGQVEGSHRWFSYKQAQALGGQVHRGETGARILFFRMLERKDRSTGAVVEVPMARTSAVFNELQIDWAAGEGPELVGGPEAYPEASVLLAKSGADIRSGGDRAFYSVGQDYIRLPPFEAFRSEEDYWATALHELVHWTGAASRLGRAFGPMGSDAYAFEELVAEIGAAFLCARLGLPPIDRHNAAYLAHWMQVGRQDKRAFVRAASLAQKAADFILERAAVRVAA
jgi:antirestriction protein ArdC